MLCIHILVLRPKLSAEILVPKVTIIMLAQPLVVYFFESSIKINAQLMFCMNR